MIDETIDVDGQLENFWELYEAECDRTKTTPNFSDFYVWLEEKYDYTPPRYDVVPDEVYKEAEVDHAKRVLSEQPQ